MSCFSAIEGNSGAAPVLYRLALTDLAKLSIVSLGSVRLSHFVGGITEASLQLQISFRPIVQPATFETIRMAPLLEISSRN